MEELTILAIILYFQKVFRFFEPKLSSASRMLQLTPDGATLKTVKYGSTFFWYLHPWVITTETSLYLFVLHTVLRKWKMKGIFYNKLNLMI